MNRPITYETIKIEFLGDEQFLVNIQKIKLTEIEGVQIGRMFPLLIKNKSELVCIEGVNQILVGGYD